ncbi:MAG TPA: GDSL-type esterase/lipase family protein [Phycisphaerae bacterium]|nr:GDSL-type esterase/lipase family protein [Phycisphaerae bacterium]
MRIRSTRWSVLGWIVVTAGLLAGCAADARPKKTVIAAPSTREVIQPGTVGNNAPADKRRGYFDFWNEQVVRQNVAVGTVFMGDSITELWELAAYFVPPAGIIVNRGISGDTAEVMVRRFPADVIQLRPRNVVILAGTNDVARMQGAGVPDDEIVRSVTASLGSMMDAARAAGINTLVCSILPTNGDNKAHADKKRVLPRINEILMKLCDEKGCVYVDYWSRMTDADGDLPRDFARDGLHPHYAGYEVMAEVLLKAAAGNGLRL